MAARNPGTWQLMHVRLFLTQHLKDHSDVTKHCHRLTVILIWNRMGKVPNAGSDDALYARAGRLSGRSSEIRGESTWRF